MTRVAVNSPVADRAFTIDFPVGTHVSETDGEITSKIRGPRRRPRRPLDNAAPTAGGNPDLQYVALDDRIRKFNTASTDERQQTLEQLRDYVRAPAASRRERVVSCGNGGPPTSCLGRARCRDRLLPRLRQRIRRLPPMPHAARSVDRRPTASPTSRRQPNRTNWKDRRRQALRFDAAGRQNSPRRVLVHRLRPVRQRSPLAQATPRYTSRHQFAIVGVSVDTDASELATFLAQEKIPWPTIHDLAKGPDTNAVRYNVMSFPTYFLVDRTGKVLYAGKHSDELEKLLVDALRQ